MNLGHGIDETTSEENAKFFVDVVQNWRKQL
jgi:uroporphyrinogen-III decarboxylase